MFWQDDNPPQEPVIPDNVVDLLFAIDCREIPVDHAYALYAALKKAAPELFERGDIAVHTIHVASSAHGWERPDFSTSERLILSHRTRLTLRVPRERSAQIQQRLHGATLDIGGCELVIGKAKSKPLNRQETIYSRYIQCLEDEDETRFMQRMAAEFEKLGITIKKALCGKTTLLSTPDGDILTRSLMLADLSAEESLKLQQHGIGEGREMGCGIFIPHKGIEAVKKAEQNGQETPE
ncbi:MAG: type I-MYXAN CRISPR-associated protein Cas6/Cmx6 [Pseudomonadota bacterium]